MQKRSQEIPHMFFLNNKLHKKISVVMSDKSVVAFCYQDEQTLWLPLNEVRRQYRKAFTFSHAADLLRVSKARISEVYDRGLMESYPENSYHIDKNRYYQLIRYYISEDDMLELRDALWDQLPKNRLGIPHNDTMPNEDELVHLMNLKDTRQFKVNDNGIIKIYRDDEKVRDV